jgi:hypothetical protein
VIQPADAAKICRRLNALQGARSPHETVWRDCFDFTFPLRGSGFQSTDLDAQSAQSKRAELLDGTGTDSARILASGLMSGLTPANSLWFQLEVDGQSDSEGRWLDANAPTLWKAIHSSNFDAAGYECALDIVIAGWFALYIDQDRETRKFHFEQWPLADCYCAATRRGGPIDTVYRDYKLTAEQAYEEFGELLSDDTKKLAKEKPDELVSFVHAIYPREGGIPGALLSHRLPIASCQVEVKAKKLVRESGYHEMPVIVPRWHLLPRSVYAIGPAADALPDMRMLNTLSFDELANADLAIAGMWIAQDDGVLNPRTVKVGPRKIVVANSVDSMKELKAGGDWQLAEYLVKSKQAAIRKIFMADQLAPQDHPGDPTAYEVHVRVNLIRQLLGPVYGRFQSEYLQRFIDRTFGLAFRSGLFTPAPQSLGGRTIHVKYISPLARAQRAEEITAMDQYETSLLTVSQVKSDVLDNYDFDEGSRERAKLLGVPQKLIRPKDTVKALREERTELQREGAEEEIVAAGATKYAETAGQRLAAR